MRLVCFLHGAKDFHPAMNASGLGRPSVATIGSHRYNNHDYTSQQYLFDDKNHLTTTEKVHCYCSSNYELP